MLRSPLLLVYSIAVIGSVFVANATADENNPDDANASAIFNERILPIFRSTDPSSCVQCHLSSVDLKNYILPSHEKTFLSLRDQGLIDLDNPEKSKILRLIAMGDQDIDEGAKLIHAKMRKAEYESFSAWIKTSCNDDNLRNLPPLDPKQLARPKQRDAVIRHARKSRVLDSFVRNVWSQRMRCFPCHTPDEIGPRQKGARKKFEDWQSQFGDRMLIFKKTPEATLQFLIEQSRRVTDDRLPMLNLTQPTKSLLVLKPTSKIPPKNDEQQRTPTYVEPIYHLGGLKMHLNDQSYKSFVAWIEDYANVASGAYVAVNDLPADNWYPTKRILRMRDTPESWAVGSTVQMFVFARDANEREWNEKPIAFTQGTITPRRIVNGSLILLAPTDRSEFQHWKNRKNRIPAGEYLVKIFADHDGQIDSDPAAMLGDQHYRGKIKISHASWRVGFPKAQWISAKEMVEQ